MHFSLSNFTAAAAFSCGILVSSLYAVDVTTSVPLPPAWSATGTSAPGNVTGNMMEAEIDWGIPFVRSSLEFTAEGLVAGLPSAASVIFPIGDLEFENLTGDLDTAALSLVFDVASGLDSGVITADANFTISSGFLGTETITFVGQTNTSPQPILVDGFEYSIDILGFSDDGGMTFFDSFHVLFGHERSHKMYAALRAQESVIPEPSTYLIMGTLLGIGAVASRRRRVEA